MTNIDTSDPEFGRKMKEVLDIRRTEARWKSDMDLKMDKLIAFTERYEPILKIILFREEEKAKLRQAIIEKSVIGAVWAFIAFAGVAIWSYVKHEAVK